MTGLAHAWGNIWPVLVSLLFFGILIMTHEAGHFTLAKIFHVRVNEFSIGMGPKLLQRKGRETQYTLRLFPIGGYVAMEGENEDSDDPRAFRHKPPWQKGLIILAGATVNLLTGVLIITILLGTEKLIATPVVKDVVRGSTSQVQGLRPGDKIVSVDKHRIYTALEANYYLASDRDGVVNLGVKRNGEKIVLPDFKRPSAAKGYDFRVKGVKPTFATVSKYAWLDSASMARLVWDSLVKLIQGQYSVRELSGPIGTISIMSDTTKQAFRGSDWYFLLELWALLAINVGVFNLIPFPALDGGQFFFIILEGIRRKPVSERVQGAINAMGMMFLIGLMVVVTISDIAKLT